MKKIIWFLLAACMLLAPAVCGTKAEAADAQETMEWSRDGYYIDENDNFLSVTWMDDVDEPGWYVGVMIGDDFI